MKSTLTLWAFLLFIGVAVGRAFSFPALAGGNVAVSSSLAPAPPASINLFSPPAADSVLSVVREILGTLPTPAPQLHAIEAAIRVPFSFMA